MGDTQPAKTIYDICDDPNIIEEYEKHCNLVNNLPNFCTTTKMSPEEFITMKKNIEKLQSQPPKTIYDICDEPNIIKEYEKHCNLVNNLPDFCTTTKMKPEEFVRAYHENHLKNTVKDNISKIRENSLNTTNQNDLPYFK